MKNDKLNILIGGLAVAIVGIIIFKTQFKKSTPQGAEVAKVASKSGALVYSPQAVLRAKKLLSAAPAKGRKAKRSMAFMRDMMKDPTFALFFNYTLDFFGNTPGAYAAARFVSLTLLFDASQENFYLRNWTQADLFKNSESIMKKLEEKSDQIDVNPYFHSRMLNMVNQLNVSQERKFDFFSKSLDKPLELDQAGNLKDSSLAFETALILSKQTTIPDGQVGSVILRSIAANSSSPEQLESLKSRVLTYYPDLQYLF